MRHVVICHRKDFLSHALEMLEPRQFEKLEEKSAQIPMDVI